MSENSADISIREVYFESGVTLQAVEAARDALIAAFTDEADIELHLQSAAESDLTLVQLIESARLTAAHEGKSFRLAEPASGDLLTVLERGGFVSAGAPESRAFWLHEASK